MGKKPYSSFIKLGFFFFKPIQRHIVSEQTMIFIFKNQIAFGIQVLIMLEKWSNPLAIMQ